MSRNQLFRLQLVGGKDSIMSQFNTRAISSCCVLVFFGGLLTCRAKLAIADLPPAASILKESAIIMRGPISYRSKASINSSFQSQIPKTKRKPVESKLEYVVTKAISNEGDELLRVEFKGSTAIESTVVITNGTRQFLYFPSKNVALERVFVARLPLPAPNQMTHFAEEATSVKVTEDGKKLLVSYRLKDSFVELSIDRESKFVENKKIYDDSSRKLTSEYWYSGFEKDLDWNLEDFTVPRDAAIEAFDSPKAYTDRVASLMSKPYENPLANWKPFKIDSETGEMIENLPPGWSLDEYLRMRSEAILRTPTPKGLPEAKKRELAEKWRTNYSLREVRLDPPRKASRSYGSLWLYLGIFFAVATAVVFAIRFWRKN